MENNSAEHITSKKRKVGSLKYSSKFDIMVQIFFATFIIMFFAVVFGILKYASKIDIEGVNNSENPFDNVIDNFDDEQRPIDKRLILLQQEENAPNEAKIIVKEDYDDEIISPMHIEEVKKQEKLEQQIKKETLATKQDDDELDDIPLPTAKKQSTNNLKPQIKENYSSNITIMSKVLVGKFLTIEEAKAKQSDIKENNPNSSPYVKKIGDIYSIQMGIYSDFATAKSMAASLKSRGYDVWIYQQ